MKSPFEITLRGAAILAFITAATAVGLFLTDVGVVNW
jgi:hypothetical protein